MTVTIPSEQDGTTQPDIFAVFAGQGSEHVLSELDALISDPRVREHWNSGGGHFRTLAQALITAVPDWPLTIDDADSGSGQLKLRGSNDIKDQRRWLMAPWSLPLVGICQLLRYWLLVHDSGSNLSEYRGNYVSGWTGHSQASLISYRPWKLNFDRVS
jgi:malonyl CoA-acyl carrier protein transacylase